MPISGTRKDSLLFICEHNSVRGQMAEAFLNELAGDLFAAESAGLEPTELNTLAVLVMPEVGHDISAKKPKSALELFKQGQIYSYVITVCEQAAAKCPLLTGLTQRLHWPFANPAGFKGTWEQKVEQTRMVREEIRSKICQWLDEIKEAP